MKRYSVRFGLSVAAALTCLSSAARAQQCVDDGAGTFLNANGDLITVQGGQVSIAGASLFADFFSTPASSNDWIDVDGDGFSGFDPLTFPFVDQLGSTYIPGSDLTTWWALQYRSVGSVRGFNEFVESQICSAIPIDVPSEKGVFNGIEYAVAGQITFGGAPDNSSGTPLTPCAINASFLDVPSAWAVQVNGAPNWNRTPSSAGYGLNPIPSSTGFISNLETLGRTCGACSISGDPCAVDRSCPGGETCVTSGPVISLNSDTANADADTLFDYVASWTPVTLIANRGTGVKNVRFTELQHLYVTGRFPNGENLVSTTRDVGSGTRNAAMNSLGIDTSWGRGDNIGERVDSKALTNLGPNTQADNCGGSSILENAVQQHRLSIGYTGLAGGSRSAADALSGKYEILNTCKDVSATGQPACDCSVTGFVRPDVDTVLNNCDACTGFQIAGSGSFVARGNRNANRDPFDPLFENDQPIADAAVADYLNNVFDSIASFDGSTEVGECQVSKVCSQHQADACAQDTDCPDAATGESCILKPCQLDNQCPLASTKTCAGGTNDGGDCSADSAVCTGGGACQQTEFCKLKFNSPGELLATDFFLPNGLDCLHDLTEPLRYESVPTNQALQNFIRANSVIVVPDFGTVNPAGLVPKRNTLPGGADVYSDGSTGSFRYWNGLGYLSLGSGVELAARNRTQGDFNGDCVRDINDAVELVAAYYTPRTWQQTGVATNDFCGRDTGDQSRNNAIPEVIGDFDGNGNLNKEDLRYFADGLAMIPSATPGSSMQLDRKQGAIAIDEAIAAQGRPFPWADPTVQLLVPAISPDLDPTFVVPVDVNDPAAPFLKTGKEYRIGDFRGDVAGANPVAGAQPMGWDGGVDDRDIDYVCRNLGDWSTLDEAAFLDLSADMNGDLLLDSADVRELVVEILGTNLGDANLDGVVDQADQNIVDATIVAGADGCNPTASCGWANGDFNCDGLVDGDDVSVLADFDGDGILNQADNCPSVANPDQADFDGNGFGDACDPDIDGDGVANDDDVCDRTPPDAIVEADGGILGDLNGDCVVDLADYVLWVDDLFGPGVDICGQPNGGRADLDGDCDADLRDFQVQQSRFTRSNS